MLITNAVMEQAQRFKNNVNFGKASTDEKIKAITSECLNLNISLKEISVVINYALFS